MFLLHNFQALGTVFNIESFENVTPESAKIISIKIIKIIEDFENQYSRFKEDSLISHINRYGFLENPTQELIQMLRISIEASKITNGVFNIFIAKFLEERGYGNNTPQEFENDFPENEFIKINLNEIKIKSGYKLDLGGIGKGFLIDKISNSLRNEFNLKYFLINAGGDIYVTSDQEKEIEINLQNPLNSKEILGSVLIKNKAICGSSPKLRYWEKEGKKYNHFIDPRDLTRTNFNSCFVIGDSAIYSDIFATCLCIDKTCLPEKIKENYSVILIEEKM